MLHGHERNELKCCLHRNVTYLQHHVASDFSVNRYDLCIMLNCFQINLKGCLAFFWEGGREQFTGSPSGSNKFKESWASPKHIGISGFAQSATRRGTNDEHVVIWPTNNNKS